MSRLRNKLYLLISLLFLTFSLQSFGQEDEEEEDLLSMLESEQEPITNFTIATFKSTRLVSGHSVETVAEGEFMFIIGHRFGELNSGWRDLFGLDNATIRLGGDFGITDAIDVGIGRSSFQKTYDGFVKAKVLRQKSGAESFPITLTAMSNIYLRGDEWENPDRENYQTSRMVFSTSAMFARKVNDGLSIQLTPMMVHRNIVPTPEDENMVFLGSLGTSIKMSGSSRINAEYFYLPDGQIVSQLGGQDLRNAFSLGFDIETGGHVFQLHMTNSKGMTEKFLATETVGEWGAGDIYFGFNVNRNFNIKKKKK